MKSGFTLHPSLASLLVAGFTLGHASAVTVADSNLLNGTTAVASTTFGSPAFNAAHTVDGTNLAHVFTDGDPNQSLSISGFNSSIGTLRFFDTPSYSERIATDVDIYYSSSLTSSLSTASYIALGSFNLGAVDIVNQPEADIYPNPTSPADNPNPGDPAVNVNAVIGFTELNGLTIPGGTQSLLLVFTPSASTNQGLGLSEIQAFVPEPSSMLTMVLALAVLCGRRRR